MIAPELLRDRARAEPWRPEVRSEGDRQVISIGGRGVASVAHEFVELDRILGFEQRIGIGRVLLCPWVGLLFYDIDAREALRRCRLQNEGLARLRSRRPDRVSVLGAVPLQDPPLAARELDALMDSGWFAGVEVSTSVAGAYLGDRRFEPFWAAAEQTGALVFIHPTTRGFGDAVFDEYYLWNLVGNPFETTVAAAHIVLAGVMERHRELKVLLAHGGGATLSLSGRLRRRHETIAAAGGALAGDVAGSLGRFLFDTVTHDPALLCALVQAVGADRVLLGSDYPFDMADPDPVATVRSAGLGSRAEAALLSGNAERLLGFEAG